MRVRVREREQERQVYGLFGAICSSILWIINVDVSTDKFDNFLCVFLNQSATNILDVSGRTVW